MDNYVIRDFKRLRMLTPLDLGKMNELVQDLTHALEESSAYVSASTSAATTPSTSQLHRHWKRRYVRRRALTKYGSEFPAPPIPPAPNVSEDSESSFEGGTAGIGLTSTTIDSLHLSDSDGVCVKTSVTPLFRRPYNFGSIESDSVNEGFSPSRPHRRKRKFKRMAVDPVIGPDSSSVGATKRLNSFPCPQYPQGQSQGKTHRHTVKSDVIRVADQLSCKLKDSDATVILAPGVSLTQGKPQGSTSLCGKRKRSAREKSVEFVDSCRQRCDNSSHLHPEGMDYGDDMCCKLLNEVSSSSLSSSESDTGIYTNDEGREGDDEQSDFYHESEVAALQTAVASTRSSLASSWRSEDHYLSDSQSGSELGGGTKGEGSLDGGKFSLFFGGFHRQIDHQRLTNLRGREIKAGKRRLRDRVSAFSVVTAFSDTISKFLQDPNQTELRLQPMGKRERDQLCYLASIYSLKLTIEGADKSTRRPLLTKTEHALYYSRHLQRYLMNEEGMRSPGEGEESNERKETPRPKPTNESKRRRRTPPLADDPASPIDGDTSEVRSPQPSSSV